MKTRFTVLLATLSMIMGCTTAQRRDIYKEVKEYVAEEIDKKMAEIEKDHLSRLDNLLAKFKETDANGKEIVKTWQDFDGDKDGHLDPMELGTAGTYMTAMAAKDLATGKKTEDEVTGIAKDGAALLGILAAIYLSGKGVAKLKKKGNDPKVG